MEPIGASALLRIRPWVSVNSRSRRLHEAWVEALTNCSQPEIQEKSYVESAI